MGIDGDDKSTSDEILTSKEGSIAADDAVVTMGGGAVGRWQHRERWQHRNRELPSSLLLSVSENAPGCGPKSQP